jgi:hypothetical protein
MKPSIYGQKLSNQNLGVTVGGEASTKVDSGRMKRRTEVVG